MQSQQCTTADASAALKIQTLIAGTPRCSRGARQLLAAAALLVGLLAVTTAFLMPQMALEENIKFTDFATTLDQIEAETALDFFTTMQRGDDRETENVVVTQCVNQGPQNPPKNDGMDRRSQWLHSPDDFDDAVSTPVSVISVHSSKSFSTTHQRFGREQTESTTDISPDDFLPY
jgi:hypothetical protein